MNDSGSDADKIITRTFAKSENFDEVNGKRAEH
jgi:hypothetical protein